MKYTEELSQSITLDTIVPQHIQDDSPTFVNFLEAYYDWMESLGGTNNVLHKFGNLHEFVNYFANKTKPSSSSYDSFARELYELYVSEYSKSYPVDKVLREDLFIKSIREVLACKGSSDSIKTFFRTVYGAEVEIEFPASRRLTYNSQAYYTIKTHIHTDDVNAADKIRILKLCVGRYFHSKFGTMGQLENVDVHERSGENIVELQFTHVQGGYFVAGDDVSYQFTTQEIQYFDDQHLEINHGTSTDPVYYINNTVTFTVGGVITEYQIEAHGSGYHEGETVVITSGSETESGLAVISAVDGSGGITELRITNSGFGFSAALKIDDRVVPDYSDGSFGGRIYSSGTGAIIRFKAGAASFWDPTRTIIQNIQKLRYIQNNEAVAGSSSFGEYYEMSNSSDPQDPFPYYQESAEEGTYFQRLVNSHDPVDYPWMVVRGNDSRNFGKLYFEMQFNDISSEFNPSGYNFDAHFNGTGLYTAGFVSDACTIPSKDAQLGDYQYSWGVTINGTQTYFRSEGITVQVSRSIPTINSKKTLRFLLDLVSNSCYVGCHDGWFIGTTSNLSALPETPVFENVTYNSGVFLSASGRFIPHIDLIAATRYSQMVYAIPENLAMSPGQGSGSSSFMFDYDPFRVPVLPWDTSSATVVNDEDEYKLTSEDVVYKYKIFAPISPRVWAKIYKACVHPAGTAYETQLRYATDFSGSDALSLRVENVSDWKPVISKTIKSISDLQEYAYKRLDNDINYSSLIVDIKDAPIYFVNQDLIVSCVETVVNTA